MIFRFTLQHDALGEKEISAPSGWDSCVMRLERHEDFNSLFEYFDGEFIFYGSDGDVDGGIDFIYQVLRTYGPDTTLNITIEVSFDDSSFETAFQGQLSLDLIKKFDNNTAMVPIIRNDFSAIFKSRVDMPVDLMSPKSQDDTDVEVFDPITIQMTSQTINKTSTYEGFVFEDGFYEVELEMPTGGAIDSGPFTFTSNFQAQTQLAQDEIDDTFDTILDFQSDFNDIAPSLELPEENGEVFVTYKNGRATFSLFGTISMLSSEVDPSSITRIDVTGNRFYQINNDTPVSFGFGAADSQPGPPNPSAPGPGFESDFNIFFDIEFDDADFTVTLNKLDTLKIFIQWEVFFLIDTGTDTGSIEWAERTLQLANYKSDVTYKIKSVFPESSANGFFTHDAGGQIMDRIIGRDQTFYSDYLGSPDTRYRQYEDRGCGSRYGLFQGLQIRKYALGDKPFAMSFMDWWKGINPILNLGLGYEEIEGNEVIRVDQRRLFYNGEPSIYLNNIKIEGGYDADKLFNKISIGYNQWRSEEISGIDDPQTKHVYSSVFRKMGKELTIESSFVAASLAIETTRRTSQKKSADYKFDNNTFIISLDANTSGSPGGIYFPELDENFTSITGLLNPETRYNSRLTPARNLIRHLNVIAGGLQDYPLSELKFQSGEGNFDMESDLDDADCEDYSQALSEKENISLGDDFLHWGMVFDVVCSEFEWEDYLTIRENRKNAIAISQTDTDHTIFFIKNLSYQPAKGMCTMQVWPATYFEPVVVDQVTEEEICSALIPDDCDNAYLTENGFEFETEAEECLILN